MSYKQVTRKRFIPKFPPSPEQEVIFDHLGSNIRINAVAGSGKSTTLKIIASKIEGNVGMMAFSSAIAAELLKETPENVTVKTCHAMGYGPLIKRFGSRVKDKGLSKTKIILNQWDMFNPEGKNEIERSKSFSLRNEMDHLVSKIKVNLTNWNDFSSVSDVIDRYGIEITDDALELLPVIMQKSKEEVSQIEFDDMMWLPIMYDMSLWKFDVLMIDEAQDLNNLMMEYSERISKGTVIVVGDEMQAIMGFAGANCNSFSILGDKFQCKQLPLSVCYRCGSSIVAEAQKINPIIQPHESTGEGEVSKIPLSEYRYDLEPGSLVISRRNATLVGPCFDMIKKGRKAVIKGRDIGVGLSSLIDQIGGIDIPSFLDRMDDYREKKLEVILKRKNPSQSKIDMINDQCDVLESISEDCRDVTDMKNKISMIFSKGNGEVTFCSIHKSKGLEADHVAILDIDRVRMNHEKMTDEDHQQEKNLHYVALTRAKKKLDLIKY